MIDVFRDPDSWFDQVGYEGVFGCFTRACSSLSCLDGE